MDWLTNHWGDLLMIAGLLLSAASMITALTPTPADDAVVRKLLVLISFLQPADADGTLKVPMTEARKP